MTLTPTNYGPNPFQPGIQQDVFLPDQLIAGDMKIVTDTVTITGAAALQRGSVLGQVTAGTVGAAVAGSNTGNGTVTSIAAGLKTKPGTYTIKFKTATTFDVIDSSGVQLSEALALGAYVDAQISFTTAAGGAAFVAGDSFTIAVSGSGSYKLAAAASVDGSQTPVAILADFVDASGGDVTGGIYLQGEFNANAMTFGSGITASSAKAPLQTQNIYLKTPVSAADPS